MKPGPGVRCPESRTVSLGISAIPASTSSDLRTSASVRVTAKDRSSPGLRARQWHARSVWEGFGVGEYLVGPDPAVRMTAAATVTPVTAATAGLPPTRLASGESRPWRPRRPRSARALPSPWPWGSGSVPTPRSGPAPRARTVAARVRRRANDVRRPDKTRRPTNPARKQARPGQRAPSRRHDEPFRLTN